MNRNSFTMDKYITEEVVLARLLVVLTGVVIHWNPIGILLKPHQPEKYRLIFDFFVPSAFSVNNAIPMMWCSLGYGSVDQAARLVMKCGRGA